MPETLRPTDDDARRLARGLMTREKHAALGVIAPGGGPMVTRIAFVCSGEVPPLTLVSDLSAHSVAMRERPAVSLLLGEPGGRGDPLTHPRLTLQARASFVPRTGQLHGALRGLFLEHQPKAKLYIDFADFNLVQFEVGEAFLNAGFGKAYRLLPDDLGL